MLDILLWPFVVGTPKGSVAASHAVSRAMAGLVWVEGPSGHAWLTTWVEVFLGISCLSPFLHKKRAFWTRIDHYHRFFGLFWMSHDFMCFFFDV